MIIMAGLVDSEERRKYFHMLLFDSSMFKSFFIRKGADPINKFEDLTGLLVATLRGVKHFKKFDEADNNYFNKVEVNMY